MMSEQFRVLLLKEWRRHRTILIAGMAFTGFPYLLVAMLDSHDSAMNKLRGASTIALLSSCLLAAFFSGNALAGERQTRSIEFLAYLPINRRLDLFSRFTVAAGLTIALFAVHLLLFAFSLAWGRPKLADVMVDMLPGVATAIGLFGVSWFLSMVWRSPVIPAALSLGLMLVLLLLGFVVQIPDYQQTLYPILSLLLGLGGLITGSIWHLDRKIMR